ncbi:hypothetical protein FJZ19_03580 [Candidatus Pacearchaeota archaeon]|nr:hypothetical protein [Candidatus Pacearchaeota archaeon]
METGKRVENQANINSRIINLIKIRGPILPIHASKETNQSLLLTGAILSSLVSDKQIKISNLKVGGSPVYFLPGQENMLENFIKFLNNKEREAFQLVKNKKILRDEELSSDLRVAIRNIKDFASSFSLNSNPGVLYWKIYNLTDEEIEKELEKFKEEKKPEVKIEEIKVKEETKPKVKIEVKPEIRVEEIQEKEKIRKIEPIFTETKPKRERAKPDKFLEEVKLFLKNKDIEILNVEKYNKKEVLAKIMLPSKKACFLLAINKKRVDEKDIAKAYKKSQQLGISYMILTKGETSKKIKESIDAFKSLEKIDKLE